MKIPALLIRVSTRPNRSIAASTTRSAVAGSPMSPRTASTLRSSSCATVGGDECRADAPGGAGNDGDLVPQCIHDVPPNGYRLDVRLTPRRSCPTYHVNEAFEHTIRRLTRPGRSTGARG